MQLGMIGLGRMGANMTKRLHADGHHCVVYDHDPTAVATVAADGATGASTVADLVEKLDAPRHVWLMVPAAVVDSVIEDLAPLLEGGDTIIDGGNSRYHDDLTRAATLGERNIRYVDVGTSGGVFGLTRGYCLMIGGPDDAVHQLAPIFSTLAPGAGTIARTEGRTGDATPEEQGWLHCGPNGAGHFVKMVHNGIEYGLMAAYAEGLNILAGANIGTATPTIDAETTPLENPAHYRYEFDIAAISEVWRRGSVISSWLLDLTAHALHTDATLSAFDGRVSDSGEGRWTLAAAIDEGVPAPVLSAALFNRFTSRNEDEYANKLLSAMRHEFGGHIEKSAP